MTKNVFLVQYDLVETHSIVLHYLVELIVVISAQD